MHITRVEIKNFRLLQDVQLDLEENSTVIVGRNNSGKTSLTELFHRLLGDGKAIFRMEDFSLMCHEGFWTAWGLKKQNRPELEIRAALPTIDVRITIDYKSNANNLGQLGDFVIDLDSLCTETVILIRHQIQNGKVLALFEGVQIDDTKSVEEQKSLLCRAMREKVVSFYESIASVVDPGDASNTKLIPLAKVKAIVHSGFITAQRGLDDTTHKEKDVLGKVLATLLKTANAETASDGDKEIAASLSQAVQSIQEDIDGGFKEQLRNLFPAFSLFGYPGLNDPHLQTETILDVNRLLADNTRVQYTGMNGINLPETYNGLGSRNLIFILLKLWEFFKAFVTSPSGGILQLIFIEEPEVHLHPQMQEAFIKKLREIAGAFEAQLNNGVRWPVQFVVTTHSSHLANRASFESMRYFLAKGVASTRGGRSTTIKNVRNGLTGNTDDDIKFLHQYLTLTRCDLFFADKAILIEGPTERLLMPLMIKKVDLASPNQSKLSEQYVSTVEVDGAYAHLFFNLLNFLELRTLVITDIDSVKRVNNLYEACVVSDGTRTSNSCLKKWFNNINISPAELIALGASQKVTDLRRVAFQIPEDPLGHPCARSFEDAFMLANPTKFSLDQVQLADRGTRSYQDASSIPKKTAFAMNFAIVDQDWVVPLYIKEGLSWLAAD